MLLHSFIALHLLFNSQLQVVGVIHWEHVCMVRAISDCVHAVMQEQEDMTRRKELRRSQTSKTSPTSSHAGAAHFSRLPSTSAAAVTQPTVLFSSTAATAAQASPSSSSPGLTAASFLTPSSVAQNGAAQPSLRSSSATASSFVPPAAAGTAATAAAVVSPGASSSLPQTASLSTASPKADADEIPSPTSSSAADVGADVASLASPCAAATPASVPLQQDASVTADIALQPESVSVSSVSAPAQACAKSGGNAETGPSMSETDAMAKTGVVTISQMSLTSAATSVSAASCDRLES